MKISYSKFGSIDEARQAYREMLDELIDGIRDKYFAKGFFIPEEYRWSLVQATAFKDNNYEGDVPGMVDAHAKAMEMSPREAADNILKASALIEQIMRRTCYARLKGQMIIKEANGVGVMHAALDEAVDSLKDLPTPI